MPLYNLKLSSRFPVSDRREAKQGPGPLVARHAPKWGSPAPSLFVIIAVITGLLLTLLIARVCDTAPTLEYDFSRAGRPFPRTFTAASRRRVA